MLQSYLITSVDMVEELRLILVLGANEGAPLSLAQSSVNSLKPDLFLFCKEPGLAFKCIWGEGLLAL